jgi:hypothetical protein
VVLSPWQVYEVGHDRLGAFTGIKKAMDLKGHKSKVLCLDFSPDLTKMVTASADGEQRQPCVDLHGGSGAPTYMRRHVALPGFWGFLALVLALSAGMQLVAASAPA